MLSRFINFIKSKDGVVFILSVAFASFFTVIAYRPGFAFNAANFTFCMGMFYMLIGMGAIVYNFGAFKAFGYASYKRSFRRHGKADHSAQPLSLAEYTLLRKKLSVKMYFIVGFPMLALSFIFVWLHYY